MRDASRYSDAIAQLWGTATAALPADADEGSRAAATFDCDRVCQLLAAARLSVETFAPDAAARLPRPAGWAAALRMRSDMEARMAAHEENQQAMLALLQRLLPGASQVKSSAELPGAERLPSAERLPPPAAPVNAPDKTMTRLAREMATMMVQQVELLQETRSLRSEMVGLREEGRGASPMSGARALLA